MKYTQKKERQNLLCTIFLFFSLNFLLSLLLVLTLNTLFITLLNIAILDYPQMLNLGLDDRAETNNTTY